MPSRGGQGQSGDATEIKQRGLSLAFRIGLAVVEKMARKISSARYFHFDLHAGGGYNDAAGCIGSPLTFLKETEVASTERYFAAFCDHDADQVRSLLNRPEVADDDRAFVLHGDNSQLLAMVPSIIREFRDRPEWAIGSILSDPNGADVPLDAIIETVNICPRLDIIFHWNSTITKRLRNGIKPEQVVLRDVIGMVPKRHWLIREPAGIHQFTLLIGRNWRFDDSRGMGFYHLDSPRGQTILDRCSVSNQQLKNRDQDELPL